jgi:hypothetical protein
MMMMMMVMIIIIISIKIIQRFRSNRYRRDLLEGRCARDAAKHSPATDAGVNNM